jgi:hypothetical protein
MRPFEVVIIGIGHIFARSFSCFVFDSLSMVLLRALLLGPLLILLLHSHTICQESTGQTVGNYAGIRAAALNPSIINSQKYFLQFNLIAGSAFFQNDFAYLPKEDVNIWGLFFGADTLPSYTRTFVHYRYVDNERRKSSSMVTNVYGPSFMFTMKNQTFGFHTAARSYGSATDIPYEIPVFVTELQGYSVLHHVNFMDKNFQLAGLAWSEIGFTYATRLYNSFNNNLDFGITLNSLFGMAGGFMKVYDMNYVVIDGRTVDIFQMNVDAGFSLPTDYNTNEYVRSPLFKGSGIGLDVGFTYTRLKSNLEDERTQRNCAYNYKDYKWRAGISLLDAGSIRFNKAAEVHQGRDIDVYWNRVDTLKADNIHQLIHDVSTVLLGDANVSLVSDEFKIALPAALSLQFDWHLKNKYYINAIAVHPVALYKYQVQRPAIVSITPRYESDLFEFGLPVSLYNYNLPRLGTYLRMGYLTIGTERIGTLIGLKDINGLDIYFSIRFGFLKGKCYSNPDTGACFNSDARPKRRKTSLLKHR